MLYNLNALAVVRLKDWGMSKNKKTRVDFIKNRGKAPRENDFTRDFKSDSEN